MAGSSECHASLSALFVAFSTCERREKQEEGHTQRRSEGHRGLPWYEVMFYESMTTKSHLRRWICVVVDNLAQSKKKAEKVQS